MKRGVGVDGFPGEEGGNALEGLVGFGEGGKGDGDSVFQVAVEGDGLGDAVFVEVGEGEDAGFFKGGVFGFQKVEARGFEFFLKGDGIAVFVQLLLYDEVGILGRFFRSMTTSLWVEVSFQVPSGFSLAEYWVAVK
jgi:hypothetical protein